MLGQFITFEGVEGSGKSTILQLIKEYVEDKKGIEVITTREPGGIEIAEKIRCLILDTKNTDMDARTEALLYAAARRQHLVEKVIPALEEGKMILCDRFVDSSLAYQGYARGIGMEEILNINRFAITNYMPHLTIYFDLDPELGLERIKANKEREVNRLDLEEIDFHHKVRQGYLILTKRFSERMVSIDANQSIEDVYTHVKNIIEERLF